ncbi:zinc-ribbon domain-containing protein [Geotalea toluenoxydans]|uniref:zinc-ribbon domain-containing protein n=1 Tax=Geotalea toluenoxydans TaxID=421624 RepID=UPI001FB32F55|nr:zinc-ribbon domain-containing protein [Geotalea toluenoxydans]
MPRISITCPHCGFRREMEDSAIPAGVTRATCPSAGNPSPCMTPSTREHPHPLRLLKSSLRHPP